MRDEALNSTALPATSPAAAYAADLERLGRDGPIGLADDAWLMLSHALGRFGALTAQDVDAAAPHTADMLAVSAVAMGLPAESSVMRAARALRALDPASPALPAGVDAITELTVATQAVAEEQELAGAFGLGYAMLSGLLQAFGARMPLRAQGNVLAQLGRTARQLGAHDLAHGLYEEAMRIGYEAEALDVVARALLGLGVLALTRGNYPAARERFERALVNADHAKDPELIRSAHHGLLNCGFASGDLDSAMVHGWNVLRLCIAPDSRAEALMNMAEICRLTGEHDAAMRTYSVAREWTSRSNVRLHALSGALISAIASQRLSEARRFVAELDELLPRMADPFTRAAIGVEVADSLHQMGDDAAARALLDESLTIASANGYHEVVHRAEQAASVWNVATAPAPSVTHKETRRARPYRSENFRMVLRSLNGLTSASR